MIKDPNLKFRIEPDGVIHLILTTNGATGEQWIEALTGLRHYDKEYGQPDEILLSPKFVPLPAGVKLNVAILPDTFCSKDELTLDRIRAEGSRRGWLNCPPEVSCLVRRDVSQEDMEWLKLCYLIIMSEPTNDLYPESSWRSGGRLSTYSLNRDPKISRAWGRNQGFIFLVSQEN